MKLPSEKMVDLLGKIRRCFSRISEILRGTSNKNSCKSMSPKNILVTKIIVLESMIL